MWSAEADGSNMQQAAGSLKGAYLYIWAEFRVHSKKSSRPSVNHSTFCRKLLGALLPQVVQGVVTK